MNSHLKEIAKKIYSLEKECQQGNNVLENLEEMARLSKNLSGEELLEIDEYIQEKFSK